MTLELAFGIQLVRFEQGIIYQEKVDQVDQRMRAACAHAEATESLWAPEGTQCLV